MRRDMVRGMQQQEKKRETLLVIIRPALSVTVYVNTCRH